MLFYIQHLVLLRKFYLAIISFLIIVYNLDFRFRKIQAIENEPTEEERVRFSENELEAEAIHNDYVEKNAIADKTTTPEEKLEVEIADDDDTGSKVNKIFKKN